jgi:hypothetical protein
MGKRRLGQLFLVLCVVVSICGFYNVLGDDTELQAQAKRATCPNGICGATNDAQLGRVDRNPFFSTYTFNVKGRDIPVRCARQFCFAGAYACLPE